MRIYEVLEEGSLITEASKALILLHGRGSTARNILSLSKKFCDDHFYIVAPQAPDNSWYPYSFMKDEKMNEPFLSLSVENIKNIIDHVSKYIPKHQIYIMGFSQGACLALEVSSRFASKYGGVIAFTGGLIGNTINEKKYGGNFEGTKVFISNSDQDPHVPLARSEQSKELMQKLGADVILKVYKGKVAHTITEDEIDSVKQNIFE